VFVTNQHIIYVPDAFTPNGDGVNDVYKVFPRGSLKFIDLAIYDRWGEKVFESYDQDKGWDGTFRGQMDDPGVYVYVLLVTFDDNFSFNKKGSISLIR
jgi:gliding motility-associated-like protein